MPWTRLSAPRAFGVGSCLSESRALVCTSGWAARVPALARWPHAGWMRARLPRGCWSGRKALALLFRVALSRSSREPEGDGSGAPLLPPATRIVWLPPLCPTSRCLVSRGTLGRWGVSELSFLCRRGLTTSRWDRNSVVKGFGGQVDSLSTTLSWTVPTSLKFWLPFSLTTVLIMPVGRGGGERCYSDRNL